MNYQRDMTGQAFATQTNKAITLLGMSGVGKTTLANRLPKATWFHYSGDYRIGTRYLEEPILDVVKRQAMKDPMLQDRPCYLTRCSNSIKSRRRCYHATCYQPT